MKLLFATQNPNKADEVKRIIGDEHEITTLASLGFKDELPETHDTLEDNALEKVNFVYQLFRVNCFAEDTGLEIEALNGEPGVYSARYAGETKDKEANMNKVLEKMKDASNRKAIFRTLIALVIDGKEFLYEGSVKGTILTEKRGNEGFGYDPIFQPDGFTETYAQMSKETKNTISHRAKAFLKMKEFLKSEFAQ